MEFTISRIGLAAALLCSVPALAEAQGQQQFGAPNEYVTQRSSPPNGSAIDVTYVTSGLSATWSAAVTQAAAIWNAAGANVQLVTTAAPTTITINALSSGAPVGITITTLPGVGTYPDGRNWNQITSATIDFHDTLPGWQPDFNAPLAGNERDLLSYLIREFGFALGLGVAGAGDPASVMTAGNPPNGVTSRVLSPGDIAALQSIYGAPEPETWALFGVGLLALGAASRSRRAKRLHPSP